MRLEKGRKYICIYKKVNGKRGYIRSRRIRMLDKGERRDL